MTASPTVWFSALPVRLAFAALLAFRSDGDRGDGQHGIRPGESRRFERGPAWTGYHERGAHVKYALSFTLFAVTPRHGKPQTPPEAAVAQLTEAIAVRADFHPG